MYLTYGQPQLISTHDSDQLKSSLATLVTVHDEIFFLLVNFCLYFFYIIVNHVMLSYFFCKQCEIINLKTWTWNFTVILGLSSFSMYSINYIQVWHMSGKDQERSHGILFWVMGSWHVKKSQGKLMSVATKIFLIWRTVFFFVSLFFHRYIGNCFVDELWWIP